MIVISSLRPLGEDSEWDRNQMMAFRTWQMFATKIFLFGKPEPTLDSRKTNFIPSEQFPRIKDMMSLAAEQVGKVTAICNGDILISPMIKRVENLIRLGRYKCAYSRRWHFDPTINPEEAMARATLTNADGLDDRGQDVFITSHGVWKALAANFNPDYRIGHSGWDGATNYAIRRHCSQERCLNFTELKLIHHPHHGGRKMPHADTIPSPT